MAITITNWKYQASNHTTNFDSWNSWPGSGSAYIHHDWETSWHYGYALKVFLTPSSGNKITNLSLTQTCVSSGNSSSNSTITAYLLSSDPATVLLPTTGIVQTASVTYPASMSDKALTFNFSGLNITSAVTYYIYFYISGGAGYACAFSKTSAKSSISGTEVANAYTDILYHWMTGFKNNEGNNSSQTNFQLNSGSWSQTVGTNFTLSNTNSTTVPKGCQLKSTMGSSSISGSWASYTIPYTVTQNSAAMYFHYYYDPINYAITYTLGGGTNNSSNPSTYNVLYGVTFSNPTPPTGYNFKNWTIEGSVVTGINAGANATFSSSSDLYSKLNSRTTGAKTVVANYTAKSITITLNANGGSGGSTSVTISYNTAKGSYPSITKPTREGYTFTGFWSASSGGTQWYDANGNSLRTFNLTSNTTWYAQWSLNTWSINYNVGDATSGTAPANQTKSYGANLTLQTNSGSLAHSNTTATSNLTNQAITLQYDANGGSNPPGNNTGGTVTIPGTRPVTWTAIGWGTSSGTTTKTYDFGGTYTANAGITLYPAWSKTNGAITRTATTAHTTVSSGAPTRTNYVFLGWSTNPTATTPTYVAGDSYSEPITASKTVTLYAVWDQDSAHNWKVLVPYINTSSGWRCN